MTVPEFGQEVLFGIRRTAWESAKSADITGAEPSSLNLGGTFRAN